MNGESRMLLDEQLPTYDVYDSVQGVVDAPPDVVYAAVREMDLNMLGSLRAIAWLRTLPLRVRTWWAREPFKGKEATGRMSLDDLATEERGFSVLGERAEREIVIGTAGRFWGPKRELQALDAEAFASFREPGTAKLACNIFVQPHGEGRSLVTMEVRAVACDDTTRLRLSRAWNFGIRPYARFVRRRALSLLRRIVRRKRAVTGRREELAVESA